MHPLPIRDQSAAQACWHLFRFQPQKPLAGVHKHNDYMELIFLSRGEGVHFIDEQAYTIQPPVLFCINAAQVHSFKLSCDPIPEGYVLIIKEAFVRHCLDPALPRLLSGAGRCRVRYYQDDAALKALFELWLREPVQWCPQAFYEGLLKSLLVKLQQGKGSEVEQVHAPSLYQQFLTQLQTTTLVKASVARYAAQLNTTPQNLNAVCRRAAGQTAGTVMDLYLMQEARRQLLYSGATVAEIAYGLDFKDPSHFVKFFKRYEGATPHGFRTGKRRTI